MNRKKIFKNKNYFGFSFVETILSVFLISAGMIAVIALLTSGLGESMDSRDQIIATLLSQEGVELVRNVRDNNWYKAGETDSFDASSGFPGSSRKDCRIDSFSVTSPAPISCGVSSFVLRFQPVLVGYRSGRPYNHTLSMGGDPTRFQRKILINYDNDTEKNYAEITSMVIWGKTFPAIEECNSASKCVYTKIVLSRWGAS